MDTTHIEYTAEDLIAHKLQRGGLLVAKPKFDRDGTDLIALMTVADGSKFCRIQCKGRRLIKTKNSNVDIPKEYVSGAFWVFLYVDIGGDNTHIFCFSAKDIKDNWELKTNPKSLRNSYYLNFSKKTVIGSEKRSDFSKFIFSDEKIEQLKETIKRSVSKNEIEMLHLIKQAQELITKNEKKHKLENLLNEYKNTEALLKENNEKVILLKEQYKNELSNIGPELPENLKEKIELLLRKKTPVDKIMTQVKDIIPADVPEKILKDYISQVMVNSEIIK